MILVSKNKRLKYNMSSRNITNLIKKGMKENLYINLNVILNLFEMGNITGEYNDFYETLLISLNVKFIPCPLSSFDRKPFPFSSGEV